MAIGDFLVSKEADYTAEELCITPQQVLTDTVNKQQTVFEADDGTVNVVSKSNTSFYSVTLQWDILSLEETNFIESLWNSPDKANGMERTFYWKHPSDGYTYTVRFMSPLVRSQRGNMSNFRGISSVTLRIEGNKP